MMPKAWHCIGEVRYCFTRSSIKCQGHRVWIIDDLNPIWVRVLGRSQLSNPSDLPCLLSFLNKSTKELMYSLEHKSKAVIWSCILLSPDACEGYFNTVSEIYILENDIAIIRTQKTWTEVERTSPFPCNVFPCIILLFFRIVGKNENRHVISMG